MHEIQSPASTTDRPARASWREVAADLFCAAVVITLLTLVLTSADVPSQVLGQ
jgi:hypothetical protein